jgi:uncharacterized protein with ATP-grasp and redox domains
MKAKPDCVACMFRQALNTARLLTNNLDIQLRILRKVAASVNKVSLKKTPAELSKPVYLIVAAITGKKDPYKKLKQETNKAALSLLPELRKFAKNSHDPLDAALHVAVAGNIIDLGIGQSFDFNRDIKEILKIMRQQFAISSLRDFRKDAGRGRKLLYLGDNAGEIVFDRLLVEQLLSMGTEVTFVIKSSPIINDATIRDAKIAGITKLVRVIETGSNDVGIDWNHVSAEFLKSVKKADVILAKGHGNFETCDDRPENFYFLLKSKCEIVSRELGVKLGDLVFKHVHR